MCVGAGEAEGADARDARSVHRLPRCETGRYHNGQFCPVDVRIGIAQVQMGRDLTMLECQHDLDEADDPRGGFQMADVGLDRADCEGLVWRPARAEDLR